MGTPSYMAPEQATGGSLAIGPRTDVYALGAILYELLTGRPPFTGTDMLDTLHLVVAVEPVSPRRLRPHVPTDLETICLKCLEKEPARRYPSAHALAEDLRRFRNGEPIWARPARPWERVWKWARRRPAVAALIGVIVVAVVALAASGWASYLALRASARRAEANLEAGLDAVDRLLVTIGEVDLADVPHMEPVRRKLLADAQEFLSRFLESSDHSPAVRWRAGRARIALGSIEETLGNHAEAGRDYDAGIAALEQLSMDFPAEATYRRDLARGHVHRGVLHKKDNQFADAKTSLLRARELFRSDGLAADAAAEIETVNYHLATILARLGWRDSESEKEVISSYRGVLARQRERAAQPGATAIDQEQLARTCNNLAILLHTAQRGEAEALFREAVGILEKLPPSAGRRWHTARALNNRANLLRDQAPEPAQAAYREAQTLLAQLDADFPAVADYARELAVVELNLAELLRESRRPQEADAHFRRSLSLLAALAERFPGVPDYEYRLASARYTYGNLLSETKRPVEAEDLYRQARDGQQALAEKFPAVPEYQSNLGYILYNWTRLKLAAGQLPTAETYLRQAIRHEEAALAVRPNHGDYRDFLRRDFQILAVIRVRRGDPAGAVATLREAIEKKYIRRLRDLPRLPDFDALEGREDFRELLERLKAQTVPVVS
jgi:tetratricopeptide (TPR) repeat protein